MSYSATGGAAYRRDDVLTATPLRLVVLTMNGVLNRLDRAKRLADGGATIEYRSELNRARALIAELLGALDQAQGGDIAKRLAALYEFMLTHLLLSGRAPDKKALAHATDLVRTIKEGFDAILAAGAERA